MGGSFGWLLDDTGAVDRRTGGFMLALHVLSAHE